MIERPGISTRKKALAIAIWTFASGAAYAQEQESTNPTASSDDPLVEEVIVRGVRASQSKAIDIKRESSTVVDAIVAEDIGKLPDTTITDSLQRVTGVQIKREANEGTSLNIRGMPQVLTTLNGEQFLSPWNITDVGANFADVSASMISGVDVYKSQTASQIPGGISGVVDLKTIKPLSLENGLTAKFRAEASQGERSDKEINKDGSYSSRSPDENYNLFVGYNFNDVVGVSLSAFQTNTYNANYSMWQQQNFAFLDQRNGTPSDPFDLNGNGDVENDWILVPSSYGATSSFVTREREGGSFTIEANIGDYWTAKADVFYTRMDQYDRQVGAEFGGTNSPWSYGVNGEFRAPNGQYGDEYAAYAPTNKDQALYNVLLPGSQIKYGGDFVYYEDVDTDNDGVPDSREQQTRHIYTLQVAEVFAPDFMSISRNTLNRTGAINSNFQLDYNNQEGLKASFRYVYAEAEKQQREAFLQQGNPAWNWIDNDGISGKDPIEPYRVTVDYRGDFPSFSYTADLSNADNLKLYQAMADGENTEATLEVLRGDFSYELDAGPLVSVDAGLRYGVRDAEYARFFYVTPTQRYADDQRIPINKRNRLYSGNQIWQRYPDWRFFNYDDERFTLISDDLGADKLYNNGFTADHPSIVAFSDFGPFKGFEGGVAALNPAAWDNPLKFMNYLYPGTRTVEDPAWAYRVEETSSSAYTQLNFDDQNEGLFGIPFSGNIGLHYIRTDRVVDKHQVPEVLDIYNSIGAVDYQQLAFVYDVVTYENSFDQWLPSINLNFFPVDDVVVRLGAQKTTARNNLENIGSSKSIWLTQCIKTDENGNQVMITDGSGNLVGETVSCVGGGEDRGDINIKPWEANVYNLASEWYFAEHSILGVGLFMIDVKNSVQSFQEQRRFADMDGIDRGNTANVWISDNVGASKLYGLEMGYKQPFTFLPGEYLSATGIEFNYTYSRSDSGDYDLDGKELPLPSNSKHQSNLILWYDKEGLNVRVAYNWKSEEYVSRAGLNTSGQPINLGTWGEPVGYLDLSVSYELNKHLSFSASGTNLTEQSQRNYAQYSNQLQSIWVQERRYNLGVTLTY